MNKLIEKITNRINYFFLNKEMEEDNIKICLHTKKNGKVATLEFYPDKYNFESYWKGKNRYKLTAIKKDDDLINN